MSYPKRDLILPATLVGNGVRNGYISDSLLVPIDSHGGRLHERAARSWAAMAHAAWLDIGVTLTAWGLNSYRPYADQERLFLARYTTNIARAGLPLQSKWWRNETWYKLPGVATAARPGTSNHGYGLAADVNWRDDGVLNWLLDHALDYGWSWELDSEPWHIRFFMGDATPPALQDAPITPRPIPIPLPPLTEQDDDMVLIKATFKNLDGSPGWNGYAIEYDPARDRHVAVHLPGAAWQVVEHRGFHEIPESQLVAGFERVGL